MTPTLLRRATVAASVVQVALSAASVFGSERVRGWVAAVFMVLFVVGSVVFVVAFVITAGRSREQDVTFDGAFLLGGDAVAARDRRLFRGAVVAQAVIGLGTAIAAPFTAAAFSVLVPMFGLGVMGLYGAKYGSFPTRGVASGDD